MVRTKVFVGNLSFTTKENELAKEFEVAGKVISANIITRGPRSLGYGFVEMENEADANNAVKLLDKKEIDGRPINVEVAKLRDETAPAQGQGQDANAQGGATRGGASRGRGPRRGRGGLRAQGQDGQGQQGQQQGGQQRQQGGQQGQQDQQGASRGARRGNSTRGQSTRGTGAPRAARPPRPEGEETRTPSTTTLFVANLPFALEDEGFSKVLKDASLAYKTAHVVKKKTGKSKGFGFIEFDTEADQQKALNALNNKDVEGRPLAVKVALTGGQRTEGSADATKPATTTPTATTPAKPTTTAASPAVEVKKEDKPATPKQEQKK